jgi:hypothetical protein
LNNVVLADTRSIWNKPSIQVSLLNLRQQRGLKVVLAYVTSVLVKMNMSRTRCTLCLTRSIYGGDVGSEDEDEEWGDLEEAEVRLNQIHNDWQERMERKKWKNKG